MITIPNIKKQIKTIDFRNAKYQGQTSYSCDLPHGWGILVDQNYTCVLAQWLDGSVRQLSSEKQILVIFGDSDKMYSQKGTGKRAQGGLLIYEGQGYKIYKRNAIVVVDLRQTNNKCNCHLLKFQISKQVTNIAHKNTYQGNKYEDIKLIKHKSYTQKQYRSVLAQFLGVADLGSLFIQYEQYIRNSETLPQFMSVYPPINLPSTKSNSTGAHTFRSQASVANNNTNELTLSMKGVENGISIKTSKKLQNRLTRINYKSDMGVLQNGCQYEQLCRKYQYYHSNKRRNLNKMVDGYLVEQIINSQPKCFVEFEIARHLQEFSTSHDQQEQDKQECQLYGRSSAQVQRQCVGNLQQYYKRSLNFVNKFINISHIYKDREYFKWIHKISVAQAQDIYSGNPYKLNRSLISYKNNDHYDNSFIQINEQVREKAECSVSIDDIRKEISRVEGIAKSRSISRSKCGYSPAKAIHNDDSYASNYIYEKQHVPADQPNLYANMDIYKYTQGVSSSPNKIIHYEQTEKQAANQRQRSRDNKSKRKYKYTELNESMFKLDLDKLKKFKEQPYESSRIKYSPPSKWQKKKHEPSQSNIKKRHNKMQEQQLAEMHSYSPYRIQDSALTVVENRMHNEDKSKRINTENASRYTPINKLSVPNHKTNNNKTVQSHRQASQQGEQEQGNQQSHRYEQLQEEDEQQLHKLTQCYLHIQNQIHYEEEEISRSRKSGTGGRKLNYSTKNSTPRKNHKAQHHAQQQRSRSKSNSKHNSKPATHTSSNLNTITHVRPAQSTKGQYIQIQPSAGHRHQSKIASVYNNIAKSVQYRK